MSASALTAERLRIAVISNNIANLDTEATPSGVPFEPQQVVVAERLGGVLGVGDGVEVDGIVRSAAPPALTYDPGNPLANPRYARS